MSRAILEGNGSVAYARKQWAMNLVEAVAARMELKMLSRLIWHSAGCHCQAQQSGWLMA
ncbi:hypothetical protein PR202_ga05602 [Eleusine coracana subsp. coracana]|uniref:Uncharacterized protein n=1 Tax=Eleusine coracana subsp. coracana TaxID=191504 RepID=A0AAV5BUM0_ELECO|nr:hypothetical protein PR202_ga05148 [Eleusine coracana subsp. coracana]GJM89410.1 hypothetical protein PR202_ga05602 [Eleusine coracana subsp. coracana]